MATPAAGAINKSFKDILFDFDKSDIRANETNKITDVAAYIKQNPTFQVGINGYRGSARHRAIQPSLERTPRQRYSRRAG